MNNVQKLPTAATSYYTVQKVGNCWFTVLVTPTGGNPIRTKICKFASHEAAIARTNELAAELQRPVRLPGARSATHIQKMYLRRLHGLNDTQAQTVASLIWGGMAWPTP